MTDWHSIAATAYNERKAQQVIPELANVLAFLNLRPIQRVLEIGTHDAGALWAWGQLTPEDGQVFAVDQTDENIRPENLADLAPRDVRVFVGDSTDPQTVASVKAALSGPVDFLFIDGDHGREAVPADFQAWRGLVAPGGVIGFHDIRIAAREGWLDTLDSLDDVMVVEFAKRDDNDMRCGIGLLLL